MNSDFDKDAGIRSSKSMFFKTVEKPSAMPELPSDWVWTTFDQICDRISVGHVGETNSYFCGNEGIPFLRSQNVRPGRLDLKDIKFVTREFHDKSKKSQLEYGDILIVRVGQNRGDCAVVPKGLGELNCANIVLAKPNRNYSDFLGYFFNSHLGRDSLLALSSGSAQLVLNTKAIAQVVVPIPPEEVAILIGQTLKTLDERITLLQDTNTTLEAIAQALFKSWFVDFDPVQAKQQGRIPDGMDEATAALFPDSFEESELGLVPKGWKRSTLAQAYEINPSRKLKKGSVAPYVEMASLPNVGHSVNGVINRELASGTKFKNGDTLLARITPCLENGKTAFVDFLDEGQIGWGSTEFVVLRPKLPLPEYHGYLLCRETPFRIFAIQSMSGTSGRQRIQIDVLGSYPVVISTERIAEKFSEVVTEIQKKITANHATAQTLGRLRDTMLPRLISGVLKTQ